MTNRTWMNGPPKKILIATDLSPRCDRALDRAIQLATEWKAQLIAVHVMETEDAGLLDETERLPSWRRTPDPQRLAESRVRADLHEISGEITIVIESGDPADAIIRVAQTHGCDLIVTGVARDEILGRVALGSTVMRLTRRSDVPLLIVRRRGHRSYRHVVVATDFSESSRHALEAAVRLFPHKPLTVFNAYDTPLSGLVTETAAYNKQFRDLAERDCEAFINGSNLAGWPGGKPEILLERGEPDQLLYDYANDRNVEIVVLGTHGRSAIFQAILGSVAQRLIDCLPCDVLVIREPRSKIMA